MKKYKARPWIKSNGEPLSDAKLKVVSKKWNAQIWEEYLSWYESSRKENLIGALAFDAICGTRFETIYEEFGYGSNDHLRGYCDELLRALSEVEEKVLRLYLFEGRTELEIALELRRSQCGVHLIKKKALSRLRREKSPLDLIAIRIMRGLDSRKEVETPSPWDTGTQPPIHEFRTFLAENWKAELESVRSAPFRQAVANLYEDQQKIIYLRFFCNQSFRQIARQLGIGVNSVQEICDVAVFRIKSRVALEMNSKMEVSSCA